MQRYIKHLNTDRIGGILLVLMGIGVLWAGYGYHMGTLNRMGPGFIPVVLGILTICMGLAIGLTANAPSIGGTIAPKAHGKGLDAFDVRGWLCILGGVASFVVLGTHGGMVPATFFAVFVSAMGDRNNTWLSAAILAAVVTVFGVAIFTYGLQLQIPLFQWA